MLLFLPRLRFISLLFLCLLYCGSCQRAATLTTKVPDERGFTQALSGYAFQSADTQAIQDDEFENPGYLWVDRGEDMWWQLPSVDVENPGPACGDCHAEPAVEMKLVAATYPQHDVTSNLLLNLEGRVNACRTRYQKKPPWAYESEDLLALTAYIANLGKGVPKQIVIDETNREYLVRGAEYYKTRVGQMNLACDHCHDRNVGRYLRGDLLSQGQSVGYPAYRLEWQTLGSLHRRLRFCNSGVRAEPFPAGSPEYVALELYLAWRAQGLPLETPAVRR